MTMNYCNKEDLTSEVLKGISIKDIAECECELSSAKEMIGNVGVNQRKLFLVTEQGTGKFYRKFL